MPGSRARRRTLALFTLLALAVPDHASAQLMLVGIDTKVVFDDNGKRANQAPGRDLVQTVDLADPAVPKLVGEVALTTSVIGPPTNIAVTPDVALGLVANALKWEHGAGETWIPVMDDRLFVLDIKARPIKPLATVPVGQQPSGLAIAPDGHLALLANRGGHSVTVLSIEGQDVRVADTADRGTR